MHQFYILQCLFIRTFERRNPLCPFFVVPSRPNQTRRASRKFDSFAISMDAAVFGFNDPHFSDKQVHFVEGDAEPFWRWVSPWIWVNRIRFPFAASLSLTIDFSSQLFLIGFEGHGENTSSQCHAKLFIADLVQKFTRLFVCPVPVVHGCG